MKRSYGIDLIRTLSIILVIAFHYGFIRGFNYGYFAIEFLFVISGFLIGQILFADLLQTPEIEGSSLNRFMMRRWFRILPLYYFCLFFKFAIDHSIGWNILYYVFFLQNHFYGIDFYPETWTLVIDEWFYLGVPVGLFLFIKFISKKPKNIFGFITAVIILINILRFSWVYFTDTQWAGIVGNVPLRQDTLLFGVLLAYIKYQYTSFFNKMNSLPVFLGSVLMLGVYFAVIYMIKTPVDTTNNYIWTRTFSFSILSFLIMLTLPYFENSVNSLKSVYLKPLNSFVLWGSKLSYALYLVHMEVKILFMDMLKFDGVSHYLTLLILVVITCLVSYLLYKTVEKPMLILRDKYYPDRKPALAPVVSGR